MKNLCFRDLEVGHLLIQKNKPEHFFIIIEVSINRDAGDYSQWAKLFCPRTNDTFIVRDYNDSWLETYEAC